MKRLLVSLALLFGLIAGPATALPDVAGAAPATAGGSCAVTWGSGAKGAGPPTSTFSEVTNVRTGRHACYDRFVVDLAGPASGYHVQYVRRLHGIASGDVIPLPGGARLEILVRAPAMDTNGHSTYPGVEGQPLPGVNLAGYQTFRSTRFAGSFEGLTLFGLGVRARLPFRVLKIGNRVVVDVAHHW
ncbi:MAG TPA: hypothetical protein VID94_18705 [Acidimicrobiales bacterium]|jgi:hypothetical protein